jgi:tetratricopeptide (TPR) repeat protein
MKPRLIDLFEQSRRNLHAWIEQLSPAEREEAGGPKRWSAKDQVAHICAWREVSVEHLQMIRNGEKPPDINEFDPINAQFYEAHRLMTWDEMLEKEKRLARAFVDELQALSEEQLTDPERNPWRNGRPVWNYAMIEVYTHPEMHRAFYYAERGRLEQANRIQENLAHTLAAFSDQPRYQAIAHYNLGCHYATTGQKDKALLPLKEAFALSPALAEWSKQDTDLASLQDMPEFQALIQFTVHS